MTSYVVYEVTCCVCKESYIGSTSLPLHTRAKEHIAAAKKKSDTTRVGEHYRKHHPTVEPHPHFQIIRRTGRDELRLRIEEAIAIQEAHPTMNRHREEFGVEFLAN